jgi:hypothetical protein
MKIKEWTTQERELLKLLYTSETSFTKIIEEIPDRTPNSIRLMASRMGLKRPNLLDKIHPMTSIAYSNGDKMKGYLLRCSECNSWVHVKEIFINSTVTCEKCGTLCYLTA